MPRIRSEVLDEDSMEKFVILVVKHYTVSEKRKHRQVHDSERLTGQEVAVLQERLETVQ